MVLVRRNARNWFTYIALGGLAACLIGEPSALAEQQSGGDQSSQPAGQGAEKPNSLARPAFPSGIQTEIQKYADTCPKEDAEAEYCIQWRAMRATERQAYWAAWTFVISVLGTVSILVTLWFTRKATKAALDGANTARASVDAAERSVLESAKNLSHAQDVAARDLRPWITIEASLSGPISPVPFDGISERGLQLFVRIRARNVGRTAAKNVVYFVAAADFLAGIDKDKWFEDNIGSAVFASRRSVPSEWTVGKNLETVSDSLAPSEEHQSRRWCVALTPVPSQRLYVPAYELCVCVVAAYTGEPAETPFYTAKVFPIGFPEVPVFQQYIGHDRIPIGTGHVAFGPVRKGKST